MIQELRVYYMNPGKMQAICDRFKNHTFGIFPRHGIKVIDFWLDAEGKEILYYICQFQSIAAKEAAWESFRADPEWIEVKRKSEEQGPLVNHLDSFAMEVAPFFDD